MNSEPYPTNYKLLTWSEVVVYSQRMLSGCSLGAGQTYKEQGKGVGRR